MRKKMVSARQNLPPQNYMHNIADKLVPFHSISDDIIKDLINNLIPDDNEYGSAD